MRVPIRLVALTALPLTWLAIACSSDDGSDPGAARPAASSAGGKADQASSCSVQTLCDGECVDLETDPRNCGACGRTCYSPTGAAYCVMGECTESLCAEGFADCDDDVANGCETQVACQPDSIPESCTTGCGTVGTLNCSDVCSPVCRPPAESCNVADDDCDGECDEGSIPGCRVAVHRAPQPNQSSLLYDRYYRSQQRWLRSGGCRLLLSVRRKSGQPSPLVPVPDRWSLLVHDVVDL